MSILLRVLVCLGGIFLLYFVRRSNIRRKITERQSLFWMMMSIIIVIFGLIPKTVYIIADIFSVDYPPSIIFAIFIMLLTYGVFHCYRINADLSDKIQELAIQVSLLNEENDLLKERIKDGKTQEKENPISN